MSTPRCTPRSAASGKELLRARGGMVQPIDRPVCTAGALVVDQGLDMAGIFDLLRRDRSCADGSAMTAAPSRMRTRLERGEHLERAAHVGVRDRVIVQIKAHVRGLRAPARRCAPRWERDCPATRAAAAAPPRSTRARCGRDPPDRPRGRLLQAPGERLGVQVGEIGEAPGGKEAVANEADRPLDPALLVAAGHRHRSRLEAIPGGQLQQRRMEADGIGAPLEHGAAKIIVEQIRGTALKR